MLTAYDRVLDGYLSLQFIEFIQHDQSRRPSIYDWSSVEYDALLKQFYTQNCEIKCTPLMDTIKRSSQEDDSELMAGGDRKRRFLH